MEQAFAMMIEEGELQRHIRKALVTYKERRDHFCNLLKNELKGAVDFNVPEGGLTVWTQFDKSIDLDKMVKTAKQKGLFMVNPNEYNTEGMDIHSSRLGFASMNNEELTKSVEILRNII